LGAVAAKKEEEKRVRKIIKDVTFSVLTEKIGRSHAQFDMIYSLFYEHTKVSDMLLAAGLLSISLHQHPSLSSHCPSSPVQALRVSSARRSRTADSSHLWQIDIPFGVQLKIGRWSFTWID